MLGNHDFYGGSIQGIEDKARAFSTANESPQRNRSVLWLSESKPVDLGDGRRLIGTGGWGDAREILVLSHVPPFREAAWHQGRPSDEDFLPFFACHATGEVLITEAERRPECSITVLCGHTHGIGTSQIRPNLVVHTTGAEYGHPQFHDLARIL